MSEVEGAATFRRPGEVYDRFMGRYSRALAAPFADFAGVVPGQRVLDVGCGPGALTGELVARLGTSGVAAFDPSPPFVEACTARHPGVDVRPGRAEAIPFDDDTFDAALAQLVLHFVTDPRAAGRQLQRVVRPGGTVAVCVWDFADGMQMLRCFWQAALAIDPDAPDEVRVMRFGGEGEIAAWLANVGFTDVVESTIGCSSSYADVDELWSGFLAGIGPAGSYLVGLDAARQTALRDELVARIGSPTGAFTLDAVARCGRARVPGG